MSDSVLIRRLKRLRGEPEPKREPSAFEGIDKAIAAPTLAGGLPDLGAWGMQALELTVEMPHPGAPILYKMKATVRHEGLAGIFKAEEQDDPLHIPAMFEGCLPPGATTGDVRVIEYDSATAVCTFVPVLQELALMEPITLIVGRRERCAEYARARSMKRAQWKHVRSIRDLVGYDRGTPLIVLDEGHPHARDEVEELLQQANTRGYRSEMVTFGPPSSSF